MARFIGGIEHSSLAYSLAGCASPITLGGNEIDYHHGSKNAGGNNSGFGEAHAQTKGVHS